MYVGSPSWIPVVCPLAPAGSAGVTGVTIKVLILTFEALCVLSLVCVITLTSLSLGVEPTPTSTLTDLLAQPPAHSQNSSNDDPAGKDMLALVCWAGPAGVPGLGHQQGSWF